MEKAEEEGSNERAEKADTQNWKAGGGRRGELKEMVTRKKSFEQNSKNMTKALHIK